MEWRTREREEKDRQGARRRGEMKEEKRQCVESERVRMSDGGEGRK